MDNFGYSWFCEALRFKRITVKGKKERLSENLVIEIIQTLPDVTLLEALGH